jgi:hypothetical protein
MTRLGISALAALIVGSLTLMALVGCSGSSQQSQCLPEGSQVKAQGETPTIDQNEGEGKGMAALREASKSDKYLFAFFFKVEDEETLAMRKIFDKTMEKLTNRAQWVAVNITDVPEKAIVAKFNLERVPMPLVLALAPNGAVTGGFPTKFEEQQLMKAFASPATEKCMKSLQDGKLVLLCIQSEKTKSNEDAMKGVNDFKADGRFGNATTVISLDPTDKKEASFLADLQVPSETTKAVTVFLAPPGRAFAKYEGATSKDVLVDSLGKANTGCGPNGCCSGGCCPCPQE